MKVTYDPAVDILRIRLNGSPIDESDETHPGVILDFDATGSIVGIEILDASKRVEQPQTYEYAVAA